MAIGAYEQTVLEMASAYTAIPTAVYVPPTPFMSISGSDGQVIWNIQSNGPHQARSR